jgi:bacteriocin biosynthesis cyclodehydratase domain-containing protein
LPSRRESINQDSVGLAFSAGLDVVILSADEVLVQFGTRSQPSELLRDPELKGFVAVIASHLQRGPVTLEELLGGVEPGCRQDVESLITDLRARGLVTDSRLQPVEQYLNYTLGNTTPIQGRSVTLLGAGPVGARIAVSLVQHGVNNIALLDERRATALWHDLVMVGAAETHEGPVHELLAARLRAVGCANAHAAAGRLDAEGIAAAVDGSDFTIVAFEQPQVSVTHLVNRFCIRARKPWLLAGLDGNLGLVGPLFVPVETACYNEVATLLLASSPNAIMERKYRQHLRSRGTGSFFPGLPAHADVVAAHAALAVVRYLSCGTSFALGRMLVVDFDRMVMDAEDVLKLPRCPACGMERPPSRAPFDAAIVDEQ